jgi:hypothetical protein
MSHLEKKIINTMNELKIIFISFGMFFKLRKKKQLKPIRATKGKYFIQIKPVLLIGSII